MVFGRLFDLLSRSEREVLQSLDKHVNLSLEATKHLELMPRKLESHDREGATQEYHLIDKFETEADAFHRSAIRRISGGSRSDFSIFYPSAFLQGYIRRLGSCSTMFKISGIVGILTTVIGIALLGFTFLMALTVFQSYFPFTPLRNDLTYTMNLLLGAAIQSMFLGVMGWVGSILLVRGVDFLKVDKGVGVVTFKVEKSVGIVTNVEEEKKRVS